MPVTITAPSRHHHGTITSPSRHHHRTITAPSPHHHHTITAPSTHHHCAMPDRRSHYPCSRLNVTVPFVNLHCRQRGRKQQSRRSLRWRQSPWLLLQRHLTAPSLHHHCTITAPSLHHQHHCNITVPSQGVCCTNHCSMKQLGLLSCFILTHTTIT